MEIEVGAGFPLMSKQYVDGYVELCVLFCYIWNSVQQNHPYDTLSIFQDKQKKRNAHIEMYD